jgi:MerR family transcriptional regulator, redox-sensitive transcriptional activator SoxR
MSHLTIGQLSQRSGMAPSAIRYYEAYGLLKSSRTSGNQRRYERQALRRVAFIGAAQRVGLSLDEINTALGSLPKNRTPTKADWGRLSQSWRSRLDEQIKHIELLRDQLTSCIGCGCLSLQSCGLYNPGDTLQSQGYGPVILNRIRP